MRKITCMCEKSFEADLPEEIDLDLALDTLRQIVSGDFFKVVCPSCGTVIKPELSVHFHSTKNGIDFSFRPEVERLSIYLGQANIPQYTGVIIGYPELYERASILIDKLDPEAIEIIKYFLRLKAEESSSDSSEILINYAGFEQESKGEGHRRLIFNIRGIRSEEIAIIPISFDYYLKTVSDKVKMKKQDPFKKIFENSYRSVRILETESS